MATPQFWEKLPTGQLTGIAASVWDKDTGDQLAYRVFTSNEQAARFVAKVFTFYAISERHLAAEITQHIK